MNIFSHKYPYTDFHELNADWIIEKMNELINEFNSIKSDFGDAIRQFNELKTYVTNFFETTEFKNAISDKLDEMLVNGELSGIIFENAIRNYSTVASMVADDAIINNTMIATKGYYAIDDGGNAIYIVSNQNYNRPYVELNNGLKAYLHLSRNGVNVRQLGAKGDGVTDDSAAFQSALDSGYSVYVPIADGSKYRIAHTLTVNYGRTVIKGDALDWALFDSSALDYKHGCIYFDSTDSDLFIVNEKTFCQFINLPIVNNPSGTPKTAIHFLATSTLDVDGYVIGCCFRNFNTAINVEGRGLKIDNCLFMRNTIGVKIDLPALTDWQTNSALIAQERPDLIGRGFVITNNRWHGLGYTYAILADGLTQSYDGDTLQSSINGAIISNNLIDLGNAGFRFNCPVINSTISNNVIRGVITSNSASINLYNVIDTIIDGNVLAGFVSDADYRTNWGIYIRGNISGGVISNNKIDATKGGSICITGAINDTLISNNSLTHYNISNGSSAVYAGISFKSASRLNVVGNIISIDDSATYRLGCGIRNADLVNDLLQDVRIQLNTFKHSNFNAINLSTNPDNVRVDVQN